jgi:hypothetical protein
MEVAAFVSGFLMFVAGAMIGIFGFLEHAHAMTSLGIDAQLHKVFTDPNAGYSQGMVQGFAGLSIFTFLLLTPKGWLSMYLTGTGAIRMGAAWFDDFVGDPILTGIDLLLQRARTIRRTTVDARTREALEGPEIPDRLVSSAAAGVPCDFAIVSSRRKPGWERGAAVFTPDACYRLGEPVERTIQGRLRTIYPLTAHTDHEVIRRSVNYTLPPDLGR